MKLFRNCWSLQSLVVKRKGKKHLKTKRHRYAKDWVLSTVYFLLSEAERFVESSEVFFPFATRVVNLYGDTVLIGCGPRID